VCAPVQVKRTRSKGSEGVLYPAATAGASLTGEPAKSAAAAEGAEGGKPSAQQQQQGEQQGEESGAADGSDAAAAAAAGDDVLSPGANVGGTVAATPVLVSVRVPLGVDC
jgi:hypothetical protein